MQQRGRQMGFQTQEAMEKGKKKIQDNSADRNCWILMLKTMKYYLMSSDS